MDISTAIRPAALLAQSTGTAEVSPWQWWATGIGFFVVIAAIFGLSWFTQLGNIARATRKEAIRQPLFVLVLALCALLLVTNTFVPFFTLGQDIQVLKDCGLATMLIGALLLAVWTASLTISNEIEGKTAMTLLSKPINRRQFVVGKYFGILQSTFALLIPLAIIFLMLVYYKVGYDARESSADIPDVFNWDYIMSLGFTEFRIPMPEPSRLVEVVQILPGVVLVFMEVAVLTALSVAIATRVPMVVNMVTCLAIFMVGHLTPVLVEGGVLKLEFVQFTAQLISTVLPTLEWFKIDSAIALGKLAPPVYLGFAALYGAAYAAAAILLGLLLFEERDLA